jgi:hypothetical protein
MNLPRPPFTNPKTAAAKTAIKLYEDAQAAEAKVEAAHDRGRDAHDARDRARRALALDDGSDEKRTATLRAELTAAQTEAELPWGEAIEEAGREAFRAASAYTSHLDRHVLDLLDEPELQEAARVAQARVQDAVREVVEAANAFRTFGLSVEAILRMASGLSVHDARVPELGLQSIRKLEAEAAAVPLTGAGPIPCPLPSPHVLERLKQLRAGNAEPEYVA